MNNIYLISCVKSKQQAAPSCRAEDMYISPLYRASLSYAINRVENKAEQIYILSAKYGLLSLDDVIFSYEKTLGGMSTAERSAWGEQVKGRLETLFDLNNTVFIFLAGEKYVGPLRKYLPHYREPMKGLTGIGNRIGWLERNTRCIAKNVKKSAAANAEAFETQHPVTAPNEFEAELKRRMTDATARGELEFTITSKELHQFVGGYPGPNHRMPACCAAMYQAMQDGDVVDSRPPSGKGASLKITYNLPREIGRFHFQDNASAIFIPARELRSPEKLSCVPNDKPGWYRWWAPMDVVAQLLNSPYISQPYMASLSPYLWGRKRKESEEYYYCVYIGVSIKESIRARLNWHVNQPHTESAVRSGTLSTLRQTLSALVSGNQYDEAETNSVIDQLVIEYHAVDFPLKSELAKNEISRIELHELEQHIIPLNIMGNRQAVLQSFLVDLKNARKTSNPHKKSEITPK